MKHTYKMIPVKEETHARLERQLLAFQVQRGRRTTWDDFMSDLIKVK